MTDQNVNDSQVSQSAEENLINCPHCDRRYKRRGLANHVRAIHRDLVPTTISDANSSNSQNFSVLESAYNDCMQNLPTPCAHIWYKRWELICNLQGKLYDLPSGTISRQFVYTLAEEIELLSRDEPSERVLVFLAVLLQRDRGVKQGKHIRHLMERRLKLWQNGDYDILISESIRCDKGLKTRTKKNDDEDCTLKIFSRLMLKGKIRDAVRWLIENGRGSVLTPDSIVDSSGKSVFHLLKEKHPQFCQPDPSLFVLPQDIYSLPPLQQVDVTGEIVEKVARKIHGSCGPIGTHSEHWSDFLLRFGNASSRLRSAVASLASKLNGQSIEWVQIRALMASRLIALDKCPGVRPIGVGECLRRILSKCMIEVSGDDVSEVCKQMQLCSGLRGGIEGGVHAMNDLFEANCTPGSKWGLLLVDAKNAFNSVNRQLALWNARIYWPRCAQFLFNTYKGQAELIIRGTSERIYSQEGVTQGDPLAMPLYAIATLPLIRKLQSHKNVKQCWYADDSSAQGSFENVLSWWKSLKNEGPKYGYFPEGQKSYMIVSQNDQEDAKSLFNGTGIKVVTGQRFLGGYIGCERDKNDFLKTKVDDWVSIVDKVANASLQEPQAAYSALVKSVQFQWTYLQRVLIGSDDAYVPLTNALKNKFLPNLFGGTLSEAESDLCTLPLSKAGLAIYDPSKLGKLNFDISHRGSSSLSNAITNGSGFDVGQHFKNMAEAKLEGRKRKNEMNDELLQRTLPKFPPEKKRALERSIVSVVKNKTSSWLSALPLKKDHFDLSSNEFRDALAIRYHRTPVNMPSSCDGCGERFFSLEHALCCKTGGLITRRHNEVRDLLGEFCEKAWGNVVKEPIITEEAPGLRGDLSVRGVWEAQREALFDIRVVDTDAPSYVSRGIMNVLVAAEEQKKTKYVASCEERHATFTPLVTSVDGLFAPQMTSFVRVLADRLAWKWRRPFGILLGWIRARLSIAIQRSASMCIRGTRSRFRSGESLLGYEDGMSYYW